MTTSLMPWVPQQFFDGNGEPLNGGKVYTYAAGTSIPLVTYSDYDGTVPNTNPVILDASGYPESGSIRLDNFLYKMVVKDINDVTLVTFDNVGNPTSGGGSSTSGGFGVATNIASATTVDLGTIDSHFANVTGTTTINSFGSTASTDFPVYLIKFQSALTITESANLITRLGNIVTATGDHAWAEYLGSGIWIIFDYMRRDGSIDATNIYFTGDLNNYARP